MRPTRSVRSLLRAIADGRASRFSQATYDAVVKAGYAYFDQGWKLTPTGRVHICPQAECIRPPGHAGDHCDAQGWWYTGNKLLVTKQGVRVLPGPHSSTHPRGGNN